MTDNQKFTAFLLRFEGETYEKISKRTIWSQFTLRRYFSPKGKWYIEYEQWRKEELDHVTKDAQSILSSNASKAAKVIVDSLSQASKDPRLALLAAGQLLDRIGLAKVSKVIEETSHSSDDIPERILRAMEERKIKRSAL